MERLHNKVFNWATCVTLGEGGGEGKVVITMTFALHSIYLRLVLTFFILCTNISKVILSSSSSFKKLEKYSLKQKNEKYKIRKREMKSLHHM